MPSKAEDNLSGFRVWFWWTSIILGTCSFSKVHPTYSDIVCPGGQAECPANMSCCSLPNDTFGCCPFRNAVCCIDHLHCCPAETTCNLTLSQCEKTKEDVIVPWRETFRLIMMWIKPNLSISFDAAKVSKLYQYSQNTNEESIGEFPNALNGLFSGVDKIICPGSNNQTCADGYSCCINSFGSYGCCPIRDAVCCDDKVHCCPQYTVCESKAGKCSKKMSLKYEQFQSGNVICPGGDFQCPGRSTCCQIIGGQYGCCPLENAVCCSDQLHCCPQYFTCDLDGVCVRSP